MDPRTISDLQPLLFRNVQRLREYATLAADSNHERVTVAQERVLGAVFSHYPQGAKLKDIAKVLSLSAATISQTIDQLVREGLLDRVQSTEDRRAISIQPTEKCARIKEMNCERFAKLFSEAFGEFGADDIDLFGRMLEALLKTTTTYYENEKKKQSQVLVASEETA